MGAKLHNNCMHVHVNVQMAEFKAESSGRSAAPRPSQLLKFMCPLCDKFTSYSFVPVLHHIGKVHQFESGFSIICGLDGCPSIYTIFYEYKTYLYP